MSSKNFGMKSYMRGALLLTIAALIVKVLSAIYRVPFQNLVGDQGFYVYQQVYPFVAIFVTWTAGGVAVAISKMLAAIDIESIENLAKRQAIVRIVFQYLTVLSLFCFFLLFFGAPIFADWMGDEKLNMPLKIGSFIVLVMPILAILKGSFQSRGLMSPIATSQVFEQLIRVSVILIGTVIIMKTTKSVYGAGTIAIFGTVVGEVSGVALLLFFLNRKRIFTKVPKIDLPKLSIIKEITLFSISVSMSSLLLLIFQLIDSFTVLSILVNSGVDFIEAQLMKGIYDRGQPLVQLGLVIASSLALAVVPLIAYKSSKGDGRQAIPYVNLTYRVTLVFAVAASFGLILVMPYVNAALFKTDAYSNVLQLYSLQIIPLSIIITMTAVLQGYSKLFVPSCFILIGCGLKWIGNMTLISGMQLSGVAISSMLSLIICSAGIIFYVRKVMNTSLATGKFYFQLFLSTALMGLTVTATAQILKIILFEQSLSRTQSIGVSAVCITIGIITFITAIAKFRLLKEKEWFVLPFGRKLAAYQLWLNKK